MQKIKKFLFQNTEIKQTVIKNAFWLSFGEITGKLFKLIIVVFATRRLGVEGWGIFSYALAFVSFFYLFGDFGINTFATRELTKNTPEKYKHISTSFIIKAGFLILFFIASIIFAPHFGKIKLNLDLVITLSLLVLSDAIRGFTISINRSLEKMEVEEEIAVKKMEVD